MSDSEIRIERLNIALHGVSSLVAEEALAGLEDELRRRLGGLPGACQGGVFPTLRVGPRDLPPGADAAVIRQLVAQGLVEALSGSSVTNTAEVE
jgi:hypothetical protein